MKMPQKASNIAFFIIVYIVQETSLLRYLRTRKGYILPQKRVNYRPLETGN